MWLRCRISSGYHDQRAIDPRQLQEGRLGIMPRRVFGQKIKGLIFIKRGFQMTLCKDKQPKLEVECRDGNLRFYLLAVIITVQYCLVVSLIYEKTDVTRGEINNLRYMIQQLHSENHRELESIRYVVATLVQRFDAWKIQSVSPNEVRPQTHLVPRRSDRRVCLLGNRGRREGRVSLSHVRCAR